MGGLRAVVAAVTLIVLLLVGCMPPEADGAGSAPETSSTGPSSTSPSATPAMRPPATASPTPAPRPAPRPPLASDGQPREARLSIPALGIERLRVRHYRGSPDDARGTRIQNGGITASPYGTGGLTGVGGIGNYLITGHRTSSTEPFRRLPRLKKGDEVHLVAGGRRYTYKITTTRISSFRSKKSLAQQSAAVPGRIGAKATRAMITLSTCRTPEDRAEGNYWSDRFGNPENRIDKIGVLVAIRNA
jgi:sortase A